MSPLEHAAHLYKGSGGDFTTDLAWHLTHGAVYCGPDAFIMGRPICWNDAEFLAHKPPSGTPDTWFIWMAVGNGAILKAMQYCPFPLKYAAWQRHGDEKIRRYTFDRLSKLINSHGKLT